MTKNWKKITAEKKVNFFWSKTAIYLSLGLHKVCPGYRRSLQLTKEAIQHFKTWIFSTFFWVIFALLDPGTDPDPMVRLNTDPIRIRVPDPDPDPQHWSKVHYNEIFCSDFELCTFHCKLCSKKNYVFFKQILSSPLLGEMHLSLIVWD
jgi:hypothetical protein